MTLAAGTKLGPYEIVAPLGAGGMGEVYRARDTKLGRDVALKVLPAAFASDAERMARFEREAQVLASLNHPNIASIYGLEESGSTRALVMELVEGPTLAERITRIVVPVSPPAVVCRKTKGAGEDTGATTGAHGAPLQIDEALPIAKQIAEALEFAHERGIIHRDLKPANVKVTHDGVVKVLDFGLAKALSTEDSASDISNSPTISIAATQAGVILGTAAYMSPEQAKGKTVDRRADIWAFGCVLYEMLTGKRTFEGETTSDVLAAVIRAEPDWNELPQETPPSIRKLLRRCLQKDPKQRLRDIGDARIAIEETLSGAEAEPPLSPLLTKEGKREARGGEPLQRTLPWSLAAVASLGAVILAVGLWRATRPVERPLTRLRVDLGSGAVAGLSLTTAISPDGRRLVFPVREPDGRQLLATRLLDQAEATLLPGTENGSDAFFSPDGQWIGFFKGSELKKISVQGGAPVTLCTGAGGAMGGSWGEGDKIVVALGILSPLSVVSSSGGPLQPLTKLGSGETTHRWPQVLPGDETVLFTGSDTATSQENSNIEAVSFKTGKIKILERGGYYGRYLPSGHLVYLHQGVLFGVKFDPVRLEVQGSPIPLLDDVAANSITGGGQFDFSNTGTFVYETGKSKAQAWQVGWLDSSGKFQPVFATPGTYGVPRLSPDGRKLAFVGEGGDIYIHDLERDTTSRLTFTGRFSAPVWAPDGKHLVFQDTGTIPTISWARSDGAEEIQRLLASANVMVPWSFSPEGRQLAYFEFSPGTGYDLWTLPLDVTDPDHPKPGRQELFLRTTANENVPRFSPDGRWIAYRSDETGSDEIFVRPFPAGNGGKWQISSGGGLYALWANTGHDLFFETADNRIMVMDYTTQGTSFVPDKPRLWSDKQLFFMGTSNLDLDPDGKRFMVLTTPEASSAEKGPMHETMLLNFFDELRRRIPK